MKRGQVTLFIILGIIIVAAVGVGLYLKGDAVKEAVLGMTKATTYPESIQLVRDEVDSCYLSTAQEGVKLLGLQGGYIFPPIDSSMEVGEDIVSFAYDKTAKVPTVDTMAQELEEYIDLMLPLCPDYELFEDLTIEEGTPTTKVTVKDDRVDFETNYVLSLVSGEDTFQISEPYTTEIDVRLTELREVAGKIVANVAKNPTVIDPEFLVTLGMIIDVVPYDENTVVYFIEDPESELPIGGEAFTYVFATRQ